MYRTQKAFLSDVLVAATSVAAVLAAWGGPGRPPLGLDWLVRRSRSSFNSFWMVASRIRLGFQSSLDLVVNQPLKLIVGNEHAEFCFLRLWWHVPEERIDVPWILFLLFFFLFSVVVEVGKELNLFLLLRPRSRVARWMRTFRRRHVENERKKKVMRMFVIISSRKLFQAECLQNNEHLFFQYFSPFLIRVR